MKFLIEKSLLQEAISDVQKAITGKSTLPILQGIYISAKDGLLTLIGSDIEVSIETKIPANIIEEGEVVLDSKIFGEIIRKLPNDIVEITEINSNEVELKCQKSNVQLVYLNPKEYPTLPSIEEDVVLSVSQKTLKNMIKSTIFAIAQDDTRPILTGVLLQVKENKLNMVALDGFRVALKSESMDCKSNKESVIPGKTLNEVSKILKDTDDVVQITFTKNHILFNFGNTKLNNMVNRNEILGCIERASLMAKDGNTNLVKFDISDDTLVVTSNSQLGKAREEVQIILQGEGIKIAFNSKYLIDVFKTMEEENITMEFTSTVSPCVIRNQDSDNSVYLLLPVRVANNN